MSGFARLAPLALLLAGTLAGAQEPYPSRPVTIVSPYPAGGATDVVARALATEFASRLKGSFVVVNREGASGVVGMTSVANAPADGYTIGLTPMATATTQPHLNKGSRVSPATLEPICGVTENVLVLVVRAESPHHSIDDLVAVARAKPLTYGSPGPNSGPSMGIASLAQQHALQVVHAPYRGDSLALNDLLAGHVDFAGVVLGSAAPFVRSGRLRPLAVMSAERHPGFAAVPTLKEKYGVTSLSYAGLFGPKGLPAPVAAALETACRQAAASPSFRQVAESSSQVVRFQGSREWDKQVRDDYAKQDVLVRTLGEKAN